MSQHDERQPGSGRAIGIARAIRTGEESAVAVVERCLATADERNPEVNAFVTRTNELALNKASRIDRGEEPDGPLMGVPFTVKDNIQTAGTRTTAGSLLLSDNVPTVDAPAVARLRAAGAVMVGKTSCPEFAMDIHTANRVVGVTRNPVDLSRTSGGSSGGDASAVSAGFAMFGLGTDYGGSVRWPAHCTGIVGMRPTIGRIPSDGVLPNSSAHASKPFNSLSVRGLAHTLGPLARSVADLTVVFEVLDQGGLDSTVAPMRDLGALKVAWFDGDGNIPVRTDLVEVTSAVASGLDEAGAQVDFARPPSIDGAVETLREMRDADGLFDVTRLAAGREDELTESSRSWLGSARDVPVSALQELATTRDAIRAAGVEFAREWPIWILPVATVPAFRLNKDDPSFPDPSFDVDGQSQARYEIMSPCWAIAMYGFPSVVIPCGRSREGLPVGVQIVGAPHSDRHLLDVAGLIEEMVSFSSSPE